MLPHTLLARYEPICVLGQGGMGVVVAARDRTLNRMVAIKVLPPNVLDPNALKRLLREAHGLAALTHPNIVRLYDSGIAAGAPYIVIEHLEGLALDAYLRSGPLGLEEGRRWLVTSLDALAHVHEAGLVHRDLKPSNIFLRNQREPVLIDFGLALGGDHSQRLTLPGNVIGTLQYLAPELLDGAPSTVQADLFALALTFLVALTGVDVHGGPQETAVMSSLASGTYYGAAVKAAMALGSTGRVLAAALQPDPKARPASAREMLARLEHRPSRKQAVAPPASRPPRAEASRLLAALGVVAALATAIGLAAFGRRAPPHPLEQPASAPAPVARASPGPGVIWLRVRPLEDAIFVHARTLVPAVLAATCTRAGDREPVARAEGPAPGYVHRLILRGLAPATSHRVELEVRASVPCPPVNSMIVRTAPAGQRAKQLLMLRSSTAVEVSPWVSGGAAGVVDEEDVEPLLGTVRESSDIRGVWEPALSVFEVLASPRAAPTFAMLLARGVADGNLGSTVLHRDMTLLEETGGDDAIRAIESVLQAPLSGRSRWDRENLFARAARALALMDPPRARARFAKMAGARDTRGAAARGQAILGDPEWRALLATPGRPDDRMANALLHACHRAGGADAVEWLRWLALSVRAGSGSVASNEFLANTDVRAELADALAAWCDASAVPELASQLSPPPESSRLEPPGGGAPLAPVSAAGALVALASRGKDPVDPGPAVPALLKLAAHPDGRVAAAAWRALSLAARPGADPALERALRGADFAFAEVALGLARARSPEAPARIRKLLASERPSDVWLGAVAAAALPGALLGEARAAVQHAKRDAVRAELVRGVDELAAGLLERHPTWVFPCAGWTSTGVVLRPGSRFRLGPVGVMALRQLGAAPDRAPWAAEPLNAVYAPSGTRERGEPRLMARIGRQEIAEVDPGAELIAQDAGVLQLRIAQGPFGDPWDMDSDATRRGSGENGWGLVLVSVGVM